MNITSRIFTEDLFSVVKDELNKCKESLLIVSPYISLGAARELCNVIPSTVMERLYVTVPAGIEFATGATCPKAINFLFENGFEIRTIERLHTKLYLFDKSIMLTGSANFTERGLTLARRPNKELLLKVKLSPSHEEYESLLEEYWVHADQLLPDKHWVARIENDYKPFNDRYNQFISDLKRAFPNKEVDTRYTDFLEAICSQGVIDSFSHIPTGMGRNAYTLTKGGKKIKVKICLCDNNHKPPKEIDDYLSYSIVQYSRKIIRDKGIDFLVLILRDSGNYLLIPQKDAVTYILDRQYRKKGWVWQFQIKETGGHYDLQTSSSNGRKILDVTHYLNRNPF